MLAVEDTSTRSSRQAWLSAEICLSVWRCRFSHTNPRGYGGRSSRTRKYIIVYNYSSSGSSSLAKLRFDPGPKNFGERKWLWIQPTFISIPVLCTQAILPPNVYVSNLGGSTTLLNETEPGWGLFAEGILTVLVVLTVLMTTLDDHDEQHLSPFAVGFSILVGVTAGYLTN